MIRRKVIEAEYSAKNEKPFSTYSDKSGKKVWWKCQKAKCSHHEWEATVYNRSNGNGCPFCRGRKTCYCDSLQSRNPSLASQWHQSKNGSLTAEMVPVSSGKKVWWKCQKAICGHHEWEATVYSRSKGNGCPYCSGSKTCPCNSLQSKNPSLASQWNPSKNGALSAEMLSIFSNKKVWWQCQKEKCGHHEWQARISERTIGRGCPYCVGQKTCPCNSLQSKNPSLASQWHPSKNGVLKAEMVSVFSSKKVWWQCQKAGCGHHEWDATINNRSQGNGCPFCNGKKTCPCNSLQSKNPSLASQWHPTKNGSLMAEMVSVSSGKKVWWQCQKAKCGHHEWRAVVAGRTNGNGCPLCASSKGEKAVETSLKKLGIKYTTQKSIVTRNNLRLRFDFYLPEYSTAIEFDGMQHFEPVDFFGGEERFQKQQLYDYYKDRYCERNKIIMVRIHYLDLEEIEILLNFLTKKSSFTYILLSSNYP